VYSDLTTDHPIDLTRYQLANCYMGRVGLINSGGASAGESDLAEAVATAIINKRAGGYGINFGKKSIPTSVERWCSFIERNSRCVFEQRSYDRLISILDMQEPRKPWWKRLRKGVDTSTEEKLETPDGIWHKCNGCKKALLVTQLRDNLHTCPHCNYHEKIDAEDYFDILFDDKKCVRNILLNLRSKDILHFVDTKSYEKRINDAIENTDLKEAMRVMVGEILAVIQQW
jgi:hypothetical protein